MSPPWWRARWLFEERGEIERLLERIDALPPDSKLARLTEALDELARDGYRRVMVFTQYTDTMDFLRRVLRGRDGSRVTTRCPPSVRRGVVPLWSSSRHLLRFEWSS